MNCTLGECYRYDLHQLRQEVTQMSHRRMLSTWIAGSISHVEIIPSCWNALCRIWPKQRWVRGLELSHLHLLCREKQKQPYTVEFLVKTSEDSLKIKIKLYAHWILCMTFHNIKFSTFSLYCPRPVVSALHFLSYLQTAIPVPLHCQMMYGGVWRIKLHTFLSWELCECEWSVSCCSHFTPRKLESINE